MVNNVAVLIDHWETVLTKGCILLTQLYAVYKLFKPTDRSKNVNDKK